MNVSKNQLVCARCHFVGLTSGIDWIAWSSGERLAARLSLSWRIAAKRSRSAARFSARACCWTAVSNTGAPRIGVLNPLKRPIAGFVSPARGAIAAKVRDMGGWARRVNLCLTRLFEIALAQMLLEGGGAKRRAGRGFDEIGGRKQRALAVDMSA